MRAKRPTSFDIAEIAGVSQSTVSRALRHASMVSEDTRQRVERAARQLNYKGTVSARALRSRRTATLALLLHDDPLTCPSLSDPFLLSLVGGISTAAARRGYDLLISLQQNGQDRGDDHSLAKRADGVILIAPDDHPHDREETRLEEEHTAFVTWGTAAPGQPGHVIGCDNARGARDGTEHLLRLGRRRPLFLGDISDRHPAFRDRHTGFREALAAAAIPDADIRQIDADATEESGRHALSAALASGPPTGTAPFDCVFAACDRLAIGALRALTEQGWRIPQDVAVIGFGDSAAAARATPPLTTIRPDATTAGERLVDALLRRINGETVTENTLVPTHLIVRGSCGG